MISSSLTFYVTLWTRLNNIGVSIETRAQCSSIWTALFFFNTITFISLERPWRLTPVCLCCWALLLMKWPLADVQASPCWWSTLFRTHWFEWRWHCSQTWRPGLVSWLGVSYSWSWGVILPGLWVSHATTSTTPPPPHPSCEITPSPPHWIVSDHRQTIYCTTAWNDMHKSRFHTFLGITQ